MKRISEHYNNIIRQEMLLKFNYNNIMEIPRILKIVIHITYKNISHDKLHIDPTKLIIETITGQRYLNINSKQSIANFKIRKNNPISCKVTLRGTQMYYLLDRLITVVLPRTRDFHGLVNSGFDGRGNFSFGIPNLIIFPEIELNYDLYNGVYGMDINIVTTCKSDQEARVLLGNFTLPLIN